MTVEFKAKGEPLDEDRLAETEKALGIRLPSAYRQFLLDYNVAKPGENQIVTRTVSTAVQVFFGRTDDKLNDLIVAANVYSTRVPAGVLPIARTPIGDLICLQLETGAVFLWEHEEEAGEGEEPSYENMEMIAPSFAALLKVMAPRDPLPAIDPSQPKGKITKAPGFAEKFKDYLVKK